MFAVVRDPEGCADLVVRQCHLALWCLPGLFWRNVFLFDLGLLIQTNSQEVPSLGLLLPFQADSRLLDLSERLADNGTARLVLDRSVQTHRDVTRSEIVHADETRWRVVAVDEAASVAKWSRPRFSHWHLRLIEPVDPGELVYLRVRFRVHRKRQLWMWQPSMFHHRRALVDLRVNDLTQSSEIKELQAHICNIVPVPELTCAVIAPGRLWARGAEPPLEQVRLLDGRAWEPYLDRPTNLFRQQRFVMHWWRFRAPTAAHPRTAPGWRRNVSTSVVELHPLRGWLDLAVDRSVTVLACLLSGVFAAALVYVSNGGADFGDSLLYELLVQPPSEEGAETRGIERLFPLLGATSLVGAIGTLLSMVPALGEKVGPLRDRVHALEDHLYRMFRRHR